jgi:hypothetical protein
MAEPAKVEELMKDETIQAVAALEPVALDPKKLVTEALEEAGGDIPTARELIQKKAADTDRKD